MANYTEQGIRLSSMCPTFLNSNSTSHTWPFSAVAELIDNAADPGVFAKQIWINVDEEAGHQVTMSFTDNGCGMTPNKLHKMLSFGFTDKGGGRTGVPAIGVYGNGFKSGSMRLGRDALIFTKSGGCQSVGMLSQTYLENIKAQCVIVPIAPFNQQTKSLVVTEDSEASLAAILKHSIVSSQEQIQTHFDSIPSNKGTKILIWNLRRATDGNPEMDFETDLTDFRLPEIQIKELQKSLKDSGVLRAEQNIPDMHYSLKAYLSILYLRPRIQIILRGKTIPTKLVSQQLTHVEYDVYKPHFSKDKVKVTFGMNKRNREYYGIMMYHKNRLIKAYEKVGCQLKTSGQRAGIGVIGIIECDFLKPAHNKQDFEYTKEYRLTLGALGIKLNDYWKEVMERKPKQREFEPAAKEQKSSTTKGSGENGPIWLQCEECLKWRSVPDGHYTAIPENWTCRQNPNPRYRSCSSQEETNDTEDLLTASYPKNHSKREYCRHKKKENSPKQVESGSKSPVNYCSGSTEAGPPSPSLTNEAESMHMSTDQGPERDSTSTHLTTETLHTATHAHNKETSEPSITQDQIKETITEMSTEQDETLQTHDEAMLLECMKRKSDEPFKHVKKKFRLYEELNLSKNKDHKNPGTSDKTTEDSKGQEENYNVNLPLVPQEESRETRMKRLKEHESKSHKLRQLLGLEIIKKTQGTMTTADFKTQNEVYSAISTREIGCQAEITEKSVSCGSNTLVPKFNEAVIQSSRAMCGFKDPEQKREKNDNLKTTENEDNNVMMVYDKLHGIRNNVLVLLTSLLPQLDLSGISLETTDVDNILQQIIEVNELKL